MEERIIEEAAGKKSGFNGLEMSIWTILAALIVCPAYFTALENRNHYRGVSSLEIFLNFYYQLLFGAIIVLIPILFKLIFGKLPLEYLRSKKDGLQELTILDSSNVNVHINNSEKNPTSGFDMSLIECIRESKSIAEKIFSRAGVYLLIGCLIAFIGVAIFYSPIFQTTKSQLPIQRLIEYLPRFGALFFIEFIAFFFLKQYRIMLEEYRYYEAIKRKRQDDLTVIELIEKYKDNTNVAKLILKNISRSSVQKLATGETTEILETQKLVNQDFDIFSKFTELVEAIKSK